MYQLVLPYVGIRWWVIINLTVGYRVLPAWFVLYECLSTSRYAETELVFVTSRLLMWPFHSGVSPGAFSV